MKGDTTFVALKSQRSDTKIKRFLKIDEGQKWSWRNNRQLRWSTSDVPVMIYTKFSASVVVLEVVIPFLIGHKYQCRCLLKNIGDTFEAEFAMGDRISLQDSTPFHKARTTQTWTFANIHAHTLPETWPSSTYLSSLKYCAWGNRKKREKKR